ncbi:MAG: sugar porter family MFS transporter [Bacteroidota bacterium]
MKKYNSYLIYSSFAAALGGLLFGFDTAVISGTVDLVADQFLLTDLAKGWFVSSALLGCIIGVSIAGFLSDNYGRKIVLILSALLFLLSAIGCSVAGTHTLLIIARLIGGIGVGVASVLAPMYIAEISPPEIRGRLVTLYQAAITIGILSAYFTNAGVLEQSKTLLVSSNLLNWIIKEEIWRGMFIIEALPALIFLIFLFFIPESPRWLISKHKPKEAKKILSRISSTSNAEKEYETISKTIDEEKVSIKTLLKPGYRIALLIGLVLPILSQLSGINVIIYYGPNILKSAGLTLSDALGGQVTIGMVNVLSTFIAIWLIDKVGRKPLLIIGVTGAMISLAAIGLLFLFNQNDSFLILIFILLFIASFAFSFGPIPWIILSEVFPTNIRGKAISIGTLSIWVTNFVIGLLFPVLFNARWFGPIGMFFTFSVFCLIAIIFAIKYIPETKRKSLEEIQLYFQSLDK